MSASRLTGQAGAGPQHGGGARVELSVAPLDPEWDAFVESAPGGHHLQTSLWAQVKAQHGWRPLRLRVQREGELIGGAQLLVRPIPLGTIGYCPRGPLLPDGDPAALRVLLDGLAEIAHSSRILYVKVQPPAGRGDMEAVLRERGFVKSDLGAAPVATIRVDLRSTLEEIFARLRAATRANIRKATRNGIVVRAAGGSGLEAFGELLVATSSRQGFEPYPLGYYAEILEQFGEGRRAELLLAERAEEVLSGAILIGYGDTVVYKMGAWSGSRTGARPNELMHWHAMQWARERGYRYYDLDGIDESVARALLAGEELPAAGRHGTTHFKLGLGGDVTLYPSAYDRSFHWPLVWPARIAAPRLDRFRSRAHRLLGRTSQA